MPTNVFREIVSNIRGECPLDCEINTYSTEISSSNLNR